MEENKKYHITTDGRKIKIADLETDYLKNILNYFDKLAEEGITVARVSSIGVEEDTLFGEKAKQHLNYDAYYQEFLKRTKKEKNQELKLFEVTLKGLSNYKDLYVVASDTEEAYSIVRRFFDDNNIGFTHERTLDKIRLVAENDRYSKSILFLPDNIFNNNENMR